MLTKLCPCIDTTFSHRACAVEEHKTRISTKMQEISSTDEGLEPVFSTMGAIQREPSLHQDFTIIKAGDRQLESETSPRSVDRSQEVTLKVPGGECQSYCKLAVCSFYIFCYC